MIDKTGALSSKSNGKDKLLEYNFLIICVDPVSSVNKTEHHNIITEILLKVAFNTP